MKMCRRLWCSLRWNFVCGDAGVDAVAGAAVEAGAGCAAVPDTDWTSANDQIALLGCLILQKSADE